MHKKIKYLISFLIVLSAGFFQPTWAEGPPAPSIFSNTLAITLISLMLVLLIVIAILGNILIGAAEIKAKKRTSERKAQHVSVLLILLALSQGVFAQDATSETAIKTSSTIGGLSSSTFFIIVSVLFVELLVIIGMLINIKFLLKKDKEVSLAETELTSAEQVKEKKPGWWSKFNKFKPVSEEAELDLGHDYDGIRELNNKLPPWWLYGFYLSILFAIVYLWRFHVSHTAPSSKEEYETSIAKAEIKIQNYLKLKGESVDENTVTLLTDEADIAAGKAIFTDPTKCPACHNADGGGNAVGPNLVDNYWIYGGSVKDIFKTIKYGTSKGMRSWKDDLSPKQIAQITSYIKSINGTKPANAKEPQGELYQEAEIKDSLQTTVTAQEKK